MVEKNVTISHEQAALFVRRKDTYHEAMMRSGYEMPNVNSALCSLEWMQGVRDGFSTVSSQLTSSRTSDALHLLPRRFARKAEQILSTSNCSTPRKRSEAIWEYSWLDGWPSSRCRLASQAVSHCRRWWWDLLQGLQVREEENDYVSNHLWQQRWVLRQSASSFRKGDPQHEPNSFDVGWEEQDCTPQVGGKEKGARWIRGPLICSHCITEEECSGSNAAAEETEKGK